MVQGVAAGICRFISGSDDNVQMAHPGSRGDEMKYLCLVYADNTETTVGKPGAPTATPQDGDETSTLLEFEDDLVRSGHALAFASIPPAATTLQITRGGRFIAEAEPCAARLIACFLIQARDLNEAIRVSGRMPGLRASRIEVRPVLDRPPGAEV